MAQFSFARLRRAEYYVVASIVLFVVALAAVSLFVGAENIPAHLAAVGPGVFVGLLLLSLFNYLLRAGRWQFFARRLGINIPWRCNLSYYFAGFAMTTTPGKLGEALRLWFIRRSHGYRYARLAPLFVGDRLSDLNTVLLLSLLGLGAFTDYGWAVGALLALTLLATLLFMRPGALLAAVGWTYSVSGRRGKRLFAKARRSLRHTSRLFDLRTFPLATVISLPGWLAECWALAWLMATLGHPIGLQAGMFIFSFSMLAGAVSLLPGGLGGVEAAMMAMLVVVGAPVDVALVATVVIRTTTLWFAVALGFLTLPLALRYARSSRGR